MGIISASIGETVVPISEKVIQSAKNDFYQRKYNSIGEKQNQSANFLLLSVTLNNYYLTRSPHSYQK
ncbi:hypothetical protein [Salipaludibacillus aurantiacus]|uniref:hypothetical protein n=1 Tax=Salipaludibacillus aurantiacus TaxID=1601833 RepID=UPI0015A56695|nr:hypothetical protein [Salipaludibacillus aurantiacus]